MPTTHIAVQRKDCGESFSLQKNSPQHSHDEMMKALYCRISCSTSRLSMAAPCTSVSNRGTIARTRSPKIFQTCAMCSSCIWTRFRTNSGASACTCSFWNKSVDHHAAHGNAEFMEPVDEAGDDGNGEGFGQGHEEKRGQRIVGEEILGVAHPVLEAEEVIHERVASSFFVKESSSRRDLASSRLFSIFSTHRE